MTKELRFTIDLARKAGKKAIAGMNHIQKMTSAQNLRDITTNVDIEVEELIVAAIQKKFPDHNIIREEGEDTDKGSEYTWMIDPIDGTKYFVAGIKLFTVSIGLWRKGQPMLGVVYNPGTDDLWRAEVGGGAFMNKKRIRVANIKSLTEAMASIDVTKFNQLNPKERTNALRRLNAIANNFYRFRSFGSGSLSLCFLAQGHLDAYLDLTGRQPIKDIGAGLAIAKEAGAKITGLDGKFHGHNASHIVATNGKIHSQLLKLLK